MAFVSTEPLDCIVVGYNEIPFDEYERAIRTYGRDSTAYRDLQLSFVDWQGRKLTYVDLLNRACAGVSPAATLAPSQERFRSGDVPNLAAVYLTSVLRRAGWNASYINLFQCEKDHLRELLRQRPACVAITTTFYVTNAPAIEIVDFVRDCAPDVPIVVGGPLIANHVRNFSGDELQSALADIGADLYVVEGQGEQTLTRLVACLRGGGDVAKVPNLLYFEACQLCRTPVQPEDNDLNANAVDWSLFTDGGLGATVQLRTARSCAFRCAFCAYPMRAGKLALADIDTVQGELDVLHASGEVRNLVFIDDTFNIPLQRFKALCRMMIARGYGFSWFSYLRCSDIDEEAVELAARSGCTGVFLGIESGSPTILQHMRKGVKIDKYRRGIALLRQQGITTFASFIVGFPPESVQTVAETSDFIAETGPDFYRVQPWYFEKGTPIDARSEDYGLVGSGFRWRHATMDAAEAIDHVERLFLSIRSSVWLPQWSLDFWFIPYALGLGLSMETFDAAMRSCQRLLALEVAQLTEIEKSVRQEEAFAELSALLAPSYGGSETVSALP